jgi:hypothetical protein
MEFTLTRRALATQTTKAFKIIQPTVGLYFELLGGSDNLQIPLNAKRGKAHAIFSWLEYDLI